MNIRGSDKVNTGSEQSILIQYITKRLNLPFKELHSLITHITVH